MVWRITGPKSLIRILGHSYPCANSQAVRELAQRDCAKTGSWSLCPTPRGCHVMWVTPPRTAPFSSYSCFQMLTGLRYPSLQEASVFIPLQTCVSSPILDITPPKYLGVIFTFSHAFKYHVVPTVEIVIFSSTSTLFSPTM